MAGSDPKTKRYTLIDLRVFLAVAEEGNLTRGAERSNLSVSSVSLRIKRLEDTVGAQLLDRHVRGVRVTPAGHVLADYAQRSLALLEQMHADLLPFAHGISANVSIYGNNNAISSFLPEDLTVFFTKFPSVRVRLEEHMSHEILNAVAKRRADIGVVAFEQRHPDLVFYPYHKDELVLLVPRQHHLASFTTIPFAQCLRESFILLPNGSALHTFIVNHAVALGSRLDVRVQVSGYRAIARLVSSGAGIGIVPRSALEVDDQKSLSVVRLEEAWAQRDLHICLHSDSDPNHFRDQLVKILRAASKTKAAKGFDMGQ